MSYFLLYLILRLDSLSSIVLGMSIATAIITILVFAFNSESKESRKSVIPWIKGFGICFCIMLFSYIIIPNTKQAAIIYCLPKIVNNEHIQKIPDKLLSLSDAWLDEQLEKTIKSVTKVVKD